MSLPRAPALLDRRSYTSFFRRRRPRCPSRRFRKRQLRPTDPRPVDDEIPSYFDQKIDLFRPLIKAESWMPTTARQNDAYMLMDVMARRTFSSGVVWPQFAKETFQLFFLIIRRGHAEIKHERENGASDERDAKPRACDFAPTYWMFCRGRWEALFVPYPSGFLGG